MKKIYLLPLLTFAMAGCVDDEGNYTYVDLNEVTIDNIESSYNVLSQIDNLKISPEISDLVGQDMSNYSFTWQLCSGTLSSSEGYHSHRVIGEEKDLDWPVDLEAGSYNLYYIVKDNVTGLEKQAYVTVRVSHPYTQGLMILGETSDGKVAVDMLSMPADLDTIMMENVIDNSQLNLRNPQKLIYSGYFYGGHESHNQFLYIMADDKAYRFDTGSSFDFVGEFNDLDLFDTDYDIARPVKVVDVFPHHNLRYGSYSTMCMSYRGYLTEDMLLIGATTAPPEYFCMPANRYSTSSKTLFKPAPYAFYDVRNNYTPMAFYDLDDDCFSFIYPLMASSVNPVCTKMNDLTGDPFSWDCASEGRTIVYGENPRGAVNQSYAVMKDDAGQYYIYGFKVGSSASANAYKTMYEVDPSIATDFDKASSYMFTSSRTSVFYTVGSRVYQYDFARKYIGYKDFADEITFMGQDYVSDGYVNRYFIATYSDANKGKIYKLEFTNSPDGVDFIMPEGLEWKTRLKVKTVDWKYGV